MEVIGLILHVITIIGIFRLCMAVSEMRETIKLVMFEADVPDDLKRFIKGN